MISLSGHVCLNHAAREAVARCPGCGQFFCRECVTEHDDRVLCTGCLRKLTKADGTRARFGTYAFQAVQVMFGIVVAWTMFFAAAHLLLSIPTDFHDGTIWKSSLLED